MLMEIQNAHAYHPTLEILMEQVADQNVYSTVIVQVTCRVSINTAVIPAPVYVDQMLNVQFAITYQFVHALLVTLVMHSQVVELNQLKKNHDVILAVHLHVDQIVFAE